jgi:ABC-type multidrug transport system fused ATPase/permease subunit
MIQANSVILSCQVIEKVRISPAAGITYAVCIICPVFPAVRLVISGGRWSAEKTDYRSTTKQRLRGGKWWTTLRSGLAVREGGSVPKKPVSQPPPADLRDLMVYLREHLPVLALAVVISLVGAALSLGQPLVVNQAITGVSAGESNYTAVLVLIGLVVGSGLLGAFQLYLLERTAEGVVLSARRRLLHKLLWMPIEEYDARRVGDLVSRVGSDTTMVRAALTGGLVDALGGLLVFAGSLIAMAFLDLVLLGITLGVVGIAVVTVVIASARIQALTQASQEAVGRVASGVERALSGVRTIRAAGATEREEHRLGQEAQAAYSYGVQTAKVGAVLWPISQLAIQVSFLAVLGVGGFRVAAGTMSVADLVTFILFLFMMLMPLANVFGAVITVRSALGALARIQEILNLPVESTDNNAAVQTTTRSLPAPVSGPHRNTPVPLIEFDGVTFSYRDSAPVLRDVTFSVAAGTTTAIVGPSGAGKSTLLALVERFYEPDSGTIRLEGADLQTIPKAVLRSQIGYVEQDAPVLAGTVRDNLVLASPGMVDRRCREVLASVNLLQRIDEHPDGLDAAVGDGGAGLSGGERQRLAIARALASHTELLLLDEPTASLDGRNERALHDAIWSAAASRTVIVVAHRLATVAHADQIVVLEAGHVVSVGTHAELLDRSPLYRELAQDQLLK